MAAHLVPRLISYAEFANLPDRPGVDLELHLGQVIQMGQPTPRHVALQHRIQKLLEAMVDSSWQVLIEAPYRALAEYEARRSDVVVLSDSRWKAAVVAGCLMGSPEVVIEVLSPSNTEGGMAERASLGLATGAVEFWVVDDRSSSITVITRSDSTVFEIGDVIRLRIAEIDISVTDVFA